MAALTLPLRARISSPLEAGPSVADGHCLPSHVNEALEYASKRLGRKAAHINLLVVRKDYQLPTSPIASPTFSPVSATSTPSRPAFSPTSRIEALKQLVRPSQSSGEGQIRERIVHVHLDQLRNGTASPALSEASTVSSVSTVDSTFSRRFRWPASPTPYTSVPVTPATPFTVMSSLSGTDGNSTVSRVGPHDSAQFGMKLVYVHPLGAREEKILSQALDKAAKKFKLDPSWLPQAVSPSAFGLPVDLVVKSTAQNETLFTSDHLTLLSLDRLYSFRTALQAYARTKTSCRLEDAVDELRRLFLANGRHALRKSALLAAYRWLDPVSDAALKDVCRMYERAYGGIERENGVENDVDSAPAWPLAEESRESLDAGGLAKEMEIPPAESQHQEPEQLAELQLLDLTNALEKEILFSSADLSLDDESELDDIEAWYRDVHSEVAALEIHPLRSHPARLSVPVVVDILPPPPSTPPPPAPTTSTPQLDLWPQPSEAELNEMRRTTPKLRPAPPGRSLALKLQTTFDKPAQSGKNLSATKPSQHPQNSEQNQAEEEEEEELTARPHSAVKSFANARWTVNNNGGGVSIDELLHGAPPHQAGSDVPQQQPQAAEERDRVGPMTPNGYDDISPITRGEWGFLMFGKGKTAKIETC